MNLGTVKNAGEEVLAVGMAELKHPAAKAGDPIIDEETYNGVQVTLVFPDFEALNNFRHILDELEAELKKEDRQASEQELGDFLFSVINAARLYKLNPDNALEMTNQKFIRRFNYIEQRCREMGKPMTEMTLGEMDELWNEAKNNE